MAATVERMLSEISVQLGTLPEAVRLQIEKQLKAELERYRAPPAVAEPPLREFVKIDTAKVGDRLCTRCVQDKTGKSVVCVVPAADFGVAAEDFDVLRLHERFLLSLQPSSGPPSGIAVFRSPFYFRTGRFETVFGSRAPVGGQLAYGNRPDQPWIVANGVLSAATGFQENNSAHHGQPGWCPDSRHSSEVNESRF